MWGARLVLFICIQCLGEQLTHRLGLILKRVHELWPLILSITRWCVGSMIAILISRMRMWSLEEYNTLPKKFQWWALEPPEGRAWDSNLHQMLSPAALHQACCPCHGPQRPFWFSSLWFEEITKFQEPVAEPLGHCGSSGSGPRFYFLEF